MHIKPLAILKNTIPILKWLPNYNSEKFVTDLVAGITVGMTLIPQSIAYAGLAGLGPQVRNLLIKKTCLKSKTKL